VTFLAIDTPLGDHLDRFYQRLYQWYTRKAAKGLKKRSRRLPEFSKMLKNMLGLLSLILVGKTGMAYFSQYT
jgi:hypothetical protein